MMIDSQKRSFGKACKVSLFTLGTMRATKNLDKMIELLNKVKELSDKKKEEYDDMITKLPKFESDFELLHKNFYKG